MEKKRIALLGGAGFIGHNLALKLKRQGHEVHVIDSLFINNYLTLASSNCVIPNRKRYQSFIEERLGLLEAADIPFYVQDCREYHQLCHLLDRIKPQVVVLLAAVSHADRSNKDPYTTFEHSLRPLENALDYCKNSVEHFIYFSSSMVYGNFVNGVVDEETVCNPLGIYGALKYAGEKIVIAYNQVFKLPYTIIRPSALYGERCVSRRVGQIFVENAIDGLEIKVAGGGEDRLDFTYVGDLVNGVTKVIENPAAKNQIFNLTYGQSRSIGEMAEILKREFPELTLKYLERDALMPARGTLSVDKARRLIGYEPQYPLEKGFVEYIKWYQRRSGEDRKTAPAFQPGPSL